MNERFSPSDWLTRLLTNWPTPLTHMILTTPLTHTLLGLSAWFTPVWRFVSASRWQTWAKISGQGTPLQPDASDSASESGAWKAALWLARSGCTCAECTARCQWLVNCASEVNVSLELFSCGTGGGEHLLPTTVQSVSVCVREEGMSKHLAWLQINENHCGLKFVWNRYAQNLASQLQLTKCQVLSGFSFCVLPMLVFCAALISNWERGKINSKKKRVKSLISWMWTGENLKTSSFHFKSFIRNINLSVGHRGGLIGWSAARQKEKSLPLSWIPLNWCWSVYPQSYFGLF